MITHGIVEDGPGVRGQAKDDGGEELEIRPLAGPRECLTESAAYKLADSNDGHPQRQRWDAGTGGAAAHFENICREESHFGERIFSW